MVFSTGTLVDLPVKADTGTMHSSGLTSWQYREISVAGGCRVRSPIVVGPGLSRQREPSVGGSSGIASLGAHAFHRWVDVALDLVLLGPFECLGGISRCSEEERFLLGLCDSVDLLHLADTHGRLVMFDLRNCE